MTDAPRFLVQRDQAGSYALTLVWPHACHVTATFATLEQIEAAALEIIDAVRFQRELDGDT